MKRTLALLLALLMITSMFVGCGGNIEKNNDNFNESDKNDDSTASKGLKFKIEGDHAVLMGRGTCTDTTIIIPSQYKGVPVTTIGEQAFVNDESLYGLVIPETVTVLSDYSIYGCYKLKDLKIPSSLKTVGSGCFWGCNSLSLTVYTDAAYFGNEENPYMFLFRRATSNMTECEVHKDTKFICSMAFDRAKSLERITLPEGLLCIGDQAFSFCTNLTSINIPDSVTAIYNSAFLSCDNLSTVTLGKNLSYIGNYAFSDTNKLSNIMFNGTEEQWNNVKKGEHWFSGNIHCSDGNS